MDTNNFEGSTSQQTRPDFETTIAMFGDDSDISEEHEHEKMRGKAAYVNHQKKYSFEVKLKANGSKVQKDNENKSEKKLCLLSLGRLSVTSLQGVASTQDTSLI